jgi:DNA modification methylase
MHKNRLICGDNLQELAAFKSESVDLIYIDPPFFSNRNYEIIWGDEAEIRTFEDRWEGGINVYIDWMKQRVLELHRVLKPTGSFYLHCDWHADHYLKVMCDEIFGYGNFRNEIIWSYKRYTAASNRFQRLHDTILFYGKSADATFNDVREDYGEKSGKADSHYKQDEDGQWYRWQKRKGQEPYKIYLSGGRRQGDVWEIPIINASAKERLGYPTQKPEALLERIITASSNQGDIVLDAFCGCGTALAVSQMLKRKWIGIDISPSAVALIKNRLSTIGAKERTHYEVFGMPQKMEDVLAFKPYEFQYWVINEMHGMPNPKKSGDMGIDGFSFLEHHPIQVKQSESVGRNVVDNFETALRRYYKDSPKEKHGYIVALSFGKGAHEEAVRAKKDGLLIQLIKVQDIIDKKFVLKVGYESQQSLLDPPISKVKGKKHKQMDMIDPEEQEDLL